MIEEEVDAELDRMAREQKTSKAALIRKFVRKHVDPRKPDERDALWDMVGAGDHEPEHHDDVIYR